MIYLLLPLHRSLLLLLLHYHSTVVKTSKRKGKRQRAMT